MRACTRLVSGCLHAARAGRKWSTSRSLQFSTSRHAGAGGPRHVTSNKGLRLDGRASECLREGESSARTHPIHPTAPLVLARLSLSAYRAGGSTESFATHAHGRLDSVALPPEPQRRSPARRSPGRVGAAVGSVPPPRPGSRALWHPGLGSDRPTTRRERTLAGRGGKDDQPGQQTSSRPRFARTPPRLTRSMTGLCGSI